MVFGKKEDKWKVNGLDGDEQITDVFTWEQLIRRPTLDHSWPFYDVPYEVSKSWKKQSPDWKKIDKFFHVLTNKRWLIVDYDTKNIIKSYLFSECQFLSVAAAKYTIAGNYTRIGGPITIMRGPEELCTTPEIPNNHVIIQKIIHHQTRLGVNPTVDNPQFGVPNNYLQPNIQPVQQTTSSHDDDPLKILKMRFVKGEISKEEFEDMKKIL